MPMYQVKLEAQNNSNQYLITQNDKKRVINFIRLIEYIKNQNLVKSIEKSIIFLRDNFDRNGKKMGGILNCQFKFLIDKIEIYPTQQKFEKIFWYIFQDLQKIPNKIDNLLEVSQLKSFIVRDIYVDFNQIIENNFIYKTSKQQINEILNDIYQQVQYEIDRKLSFCIEIKDEGLFWQNTTNLQIFNEQDVNLEYAKNQLLNTEQQKQKIEETLNDFSKGFLNVLSLKNKNIANDHLHQKQEFFKNKIYQKMILLQNNCDKLMERQLKNLSKQVDDLDQYNELINSQKEFQTNEENLLNEINQIQQISYVIRQFDLSKIKEEDYELTEKIQKNLQSLKLLDIQAKNNIKKLANQNIDSLQQNKNQIIHQIRDLNLSIQQGVFIIDDLEEINMNTVLKDIDNVKKQFEICDKNILQLKQRYNQLNDYEVLMKQPQEQSLELQFLENRFNDRRLIWNNIEAFQKNQKEWRQKEFNSLDIEYIENQMRHYESSNNQLKQRINNVSEKGYDKQLEFFINEIKQFQQLLPIILCLGNKDVKEKHWLQMNTSINSQITSSKCFTIDQLIGFDIFQQKDNLLEISQKATGEQLISNQIANIKKKWDEMNFMIVQFDDSPNKLKLTGIDEIIQTLDDHLVSIQGILSTRFVQEIRQDIEYWQNKLLLIQDTIDEWLTLQRNWIYLENIFNAQDIQRQLPDETQLFFNVNKFWRDLMIRSKKFPSVQQYCNNQELLLKLQFNNKQLDQILKSLDQYLNSKRLGFPRFYFLSNDELLEVLSQTKNPTSIQPHLRKLFDNINSITFDADEGDDKIVLSMTSSEPEQMPETVIYTQKVKIIAGEKVEQFLSKLQEQMKHTLRTKTMEAYKSYLPKIENYIIWIFIDQPAQCLITATLVKWQENMVNSIQTINENPQSLEISHKNQVERINELIKQVKKNLNHHQQQLICTFLITEVHLRDINELFIDDNIQDLEDFNWVKQLRYYVDASQNDIKVLQTSSQLELSFEYLGNCSRLVVTNLTDKCFLTMTGAMNFFLGGNPSGPAGTGKTETIKDLSKSLQIKCVVFNCSDTLDYLTMGRFFSGICQCGCWVCLDEFNRINLEVLSVVAQQIQYIQKALAAKQKEFQFDDQKIIIYKTVGIFITTNPTYSGRQELPDNLKLLFRPLAMMVPDYQQICEITLMSDGFLDARVLGMKIVLLYKLCLEQLSYQVHYDFGLRAIKSVILFAGQKRRQDSQDKSEELILIQSILDSSLPKFIEQDIDIFQEIIRDLFPNQQYDKQINQQLSETLVKVMTQKKYDLKETFIQKIYQMVETTDIRIGVMIIGKTGTGKTTIYNLIQQTYEHLHLVEKNLSFNQIVLTMINPKAVSTNGLYGYVNLLTNDWHDGIVAKVIRSAIQDKTEEKQWIVFDGPVDTLWAENLNTVLDDNRMLCLSNGQRIKLPSNIQFIFEVENLIMASPATVSRCGMVFIDQTQLGWLPIFNNWQQDFIAKMLNYNMNQQVQITSQTYKAFQLMCKRFVNQLQEFQSQNKKDFIEFIESCELQQVQGSIKIIEALMQKLATHLGSFGVLEKISVLEVEHYFNMILIFSYTWGIGGNYFNNDTYLGRSKFGEITKSKFQTIYPSMPVEGDLFDFFIDFQAIRFKTWDSVVQKYHYDRNTSFFNILVPTSDSFKYNYIIELLISNQFNVLLTGNSGVGKTVIIKEYLQNLDSQNYIYKLLNFSAQTNTQNMIDIFQDKDKFNKKKRDIIGAPLGKKIVLFVDDINMPLPDRFGSQPPIEFLRQIIGHGGFYDLKKINFINLQDCTILAACGPPGGGRNYVTPRLFRYFNILWIQEITEKTLLQIYDQILYGFLKNNPKDNTSEKSKVIVKSSIKMYTFLCQKLLPTPQKCHYTFNPRDVARVFQGILQIKYMYLTDITVLVELWSHEFQRIFQDRLVSNVDRDMFYQIMISEIQANLLFTQYSKQYLKDICFSDLDSKEYFYTQVQEIDSLAKPLQVNLDLYNQQNRKMNLIFFTEAIQQLAKICRIIKIEQGNAILIGLGGSGRNSLTQLSSFIRGYRNFSIEITNTYNETNWKDDLRKLLKQTGAKNIQTVLILSDNNIQKESYLEDVNNILNTGEVPNLMAFEDLEEIYSEMRIIVKERGLFESRENMSRLFIQLIRENLHIVISFSPVGDKLRNRCRQFPAIINGCTIIWFEKWPNEALNSVAFRELQQQDNLGVGHYKVILARSMVEMNQHIQDEADKFSIIEKRKVYITPSVFLELVKVFINLMKIQQNILPLNLRKYSMGLQTLKDTNTTVETLQKTIREYQPVLEKSQKENAELLIVLDKNSKEAKETEQFVQKETNDAQIKKDEVNELKKACQKEYEEALPTLKAAQAAVMNIDKTQLNIIKSYVNPPKLVVTVLEATCLLFGLEESWDTSKRHLLGDMRFLEKLIDFDIKKTPESKFLKLREKYFSLSDFKKDIIIKQSEAAGSIYQWLIAIDMYQKVKKNVDPKERKLIEAQTYLEKVDSMLADKKDILNKIQDKVSTLNQQLNTSQATSNSLNQQIQLAQIQLTRAEKLVNGLQNEAERWEISFNNIQQNINNLIGNILLSSAYLVYLGPFNQEYRHQLQVKWISMFQVFNIPLIQDYKLQKQLQIIKVIFL